MSACGRWWCTCSHSARSSSSCAEGAASMAQQLRRTQTRRTPKGSSLQALEYKVRVSWYSRDGLTLAFRRMGSDVKALRERGIVRVGLHLVIKRMDYGNFNVEQRIARRPDAHRGTLDCGRRVKGITVQSTGYGVQWPSVCSRARQCRAHPQWAPARGCRVLDRDSGFERTVSFSRVIHWH